MSDFLLPFVRGFRHRMENKLMPLECYGNALPSGDEKLSKLDGNPYYAIPGHICVVQGFSLDQRGLTCTHLRGKLIVVGILVVSQDGTAHTHSHVHPDLMLDTWKHKMKRKLITFSHYKLLNSEICCPRFSI